MSSPPIFDAQPIAVRLSVGLRQYAASVALAMFVCVAILFFKAHPVPFLESYGGVIAVSAILIREMWNRYRLFRIKRLLMNSARSSSSARTGEVSELLNDELRRILEFQALLANQENQGPRDGSPSKAALHQHSK